ncbi:MAG: hypothetical protein Q9160_002433 [Pyrenula sp. 1 TL-2023]
MRLTTSSCRPYICLFCRVHHNERIVSSRQAFSLLSTVLGHENTPPPPPSIDAAETKHPLQPSPTAQVSQSPSGNGEPIRASKDKLKREEATQTPKEKAQKLYFPARDKAQKTSQGGLIEDQISKAPQEASGKETENSGSAGLRAFLRLGQLLHNGPSLENKDILALHRTLREELDKIGLALDDKEAMRKAYLSNPPLKKFFHNRISTLEKIFNANTIKTKDERKVCKALMRSGERKKLTSALLRSKSGKSSAEEDGERKRPTEVEPKQENYSPLGLPTKDHVQSPEAGKTLPSSPVSGDTDHRAQSAAPQSAQSGALSASIDRQSIDSNSLNLIRMQTEQPPIPTLTHDLQRVLFNPGVYQLQDPRSRVYNFDPYLKSIMPITEFDFSALKDYVISSKDDTLRKLGTELGKKYMGSSSNMTSVLSHFHYLLSSWREVNTSMLTRSFPEKGTSFVHTQRAPAAVFLKYRDGIYAIDSDKEFDSQNILMGLGRSLEKLLTSSKEKFELYRRSSKEKMPEEERNQREAYHYSHLGDFLMRSQLDAKDPRLPGTGVFDLKTRAVISIRMDAQNFQNGIGYQIRDRFGQFESYEREFYDMIRSAFLKYSLQVRMGNMDGIFVAFHNIESIFGFQYISLPEMDAAVHGQSDLTLGDREFKISLKLWNQVLDKVTAKFPGRSLRMHFETRESKVRPFMYVFAEPVDEDRIQRIQESKANAWDELMHKLHKSTMTDAESEEAEADTDSSKLPSTDADASFLDQLSKVKSSVEGTEGAQPPATDDDSPKQSSPSELCCLLLTIQNRINQAPVTRPTDISESDVWNVDVDITEVNDKRTHQLYDACQKRRRALLDSDLRGDGAARGFTERLRELTQKGRTWKQEQGELDASREPVILYDVDE